MTARLAALLALLLGPPATMAAELVTLAGVRSAGALVAVDARGVTLGGRTTPLDRVASVTLAKPEARPPKYDEVELTDGSTLAVADFAVKQKSVALTLLKAGVAVELPLAGLAWLARNAGDAEARKAFEAVVAARGKRDLFVVKQAAGLNALPGTILGGTDAGDALAFEREDGRRINLKLSRATGGLVLNPPRRDVVPPTLCRVNDILGNSLVAQSVVVESGRVTVTTVAGCVVRYDSVDLLARLDFALGNTRQLADLGGRVESPPGEDDGPLGKQFPIAAQVGTDKAVGGGPIVLDGKSYARGVSVPPGAAVAYPLAGQFREFRATVGVQDGVNRGAVALRLRVELDGRAAFDGVVKKSDPPRELAIDVRGARELRLSVVRAGAAFDGDQLNLADACVQK